MKGYFFHTVYLRCEVQKQICKKALRQTNKKKCPSVAHLDAKIHRVPQPLTAETWESIAEKVYRIHLLCLRLHGADPISLTLGICVGLSSYICSSTRNKKERFELNSRSIYSSSRSTGSLKLFRLYFHDVKYLAKITTCL